MMLSEVKKNKKNKLITRLIVSFLVVIALATYFAKSINNLLLPTVDTVELKKGNLVTNLRWDGTIDYAAKYTIFAKDNWCIEKILVKMNQPVKTGEKLAKVDMNGISIERKSKELEILRLQNEIKGLKKAEQPDKDIINEKTAQLDLAKEECLEIGKGLTADGYILAQWDGCAVGINVIEGQTAQANEKVFDMARQEGGYIASWSVNNTDDAKLSAGAKVELTLEDGKSVTSIPAEVTGQTYFKDNNSYLFTAKLDEESMKGQSIQAGESFKITYTIRSLQSYSLLPKACVVEDGAGATKIYYVNQREGIFGTENYIDQIDVKLIDSDNANYAIKELSFIKNIVLASSKPIEKGIQVKVR